MSDVETLSAVVTKIHATRGGWFAGSMRMEQDDRVVKVSGVLPGVAVGSRIMGEFKQVMSSHGLSYVLQPPKLKAIPKKDLPPDIEITLQQLPITPESIVSYLSDTLTGVGAGRASALVERMGPEACIKAFEEGSVDALIGAGFSLALATSAINEWAERGAEPRPMIALRSIGLNKAQIKAALNAAINRGAVDVVTAAIRVCQHPYRLSKISSIGFKTADVAAGKFGVGRHDQSRLMAGIRQALIKISEDGETARPVMGLVKETLSLLNPRQQELADSDRVTAPEVLEHIRNIDEVRDGIVFPLKSREPEAPVSLAYLARTELSIADHVVRLSNARVSKEIPTPTVEECNAIAGLNLDIRQYEALRRSLDNNNPFSIITGGPGCGKSTIVNTLVKLAARAGLTTILAAPTGRAARRLTEVTQQSASTTYRLIGSNGRGQVKHHSDNPLAVDMLVIDEMTMNDVLISNLVLDAVASGTRVVKVGDPDQLPSVGPGAVLANLIESSTVPVSRLTVGHRSGKGSPISEFARNIRDGVKKLPKDEDSRMEGIYLRDDESIFNLVIQRYQEAMEKGVRPEDFVLLTAMKKGMLGTDWLNHSVQKILNPIAQTKGLEIRPNEVGAVRAAPGDRVMQLVNQVDELGIVNGDVGTIIRMDSRKGELAVDFGTGGEVLIKGSHLRNLSLAYTTTIHKSQGSEYQHGVMAVSRSHMEMLRRNLLYTGVTRIKSNLALIGDRQAIERGITDTGDYERRTLLTAFLKTRFGEVMKVPPPERVPPQGDLFPSP